MLAPNCGCSTRIPLALLDHLVLLPNKNFGLDLKARCNKTTKSIANVVIVPFVICEAIEEAERAAAKA